MKAKLNKSNIIFLVIILLLIIPQTRQPIQIWFHKGFSYLNQSTLIDNSERIKIANTNWQLQSDNGTTLNFESIQGEVTLINFWATWCPPCIAEMPSLQEIYNDYVDKVKFIFVTNDDFEIVNNFKSKRNYTFEVYNSITEIPQELVAKSIPRTFIINKNNEIVIDESGAVDWNSDNVRSQLDQLLSE